MTLTLRPLTMHDEAEARLLHAQLAEDGFDFLLADVDAPWADIVAEAARYAAGVDLPPGRVRSDFLVAEVDGRIVGRTSIRHGLTPYLAEVGGHVGYGVGPEFRRRGCATQILRASVERLRRLGVARILVTCDDTNVGSARVIERCGGVLEDVRPVPGGVPKRRYWITSADGPGEDAGTAGDHTPGSSSL